MQCQSWVCGCDATLYQITLHTRWLQVCAKNHEKYANLFCWVDQTYYVPFEAPMPQRDEGRDRKITYYQWVPIILMLQAGMFAVPYVLWRVLSSRSGIDLATIVGAARSSQASSSPDERQKMLRFAIRHDSQRKTYYCRNDYCHFISYLPIECLRMLLYALRMDWNFGTLLEVSLMLHSFRFHYIYPCEKNYDS